MIVNGMIIWLIIYNKYISTFGHRDGKHGGHHCLKCHLLQTITLSIIIYIHKLFESKSIS